MSKTGATEQTTGEDPPGLRSEHSVRSDTPLDRSALRKPETPPHRPPAGITRQASGGSRSLNVADDFFLPDFCHPRMVLAVVLISELLAVMFTLVRPSSSALLLTDLARLSLFVQWLGLTSAGLLCCARRWLYPLSVPVATTAIFTLLMANTAVFSGLALWLGSSQRALGVDYGLFPSEPWPFLLRNEGICAIVIALLLRYFFVAHQWRHHVRAEARSRIHALQARMRPHFLFNSMNTIAALTRSDPARAEEAVEDLADLFRATLKDSDHPLHIKEELELTRVYQRIEEARIGDRLKVIWDVANVPMRALIPSLTIQPLLENAIYHGIEPIEAGGTVTISGRVDGRSVVFTLTNPVAPGSAGAQRPGNRHALENIRQRLRLAYDQHGDLQVTEDASLYTVMIRFPLEYERAG